MAAELVQANDVAAYTEYPGGLIALRCSEFMGPARGTLTSGLDSMASSGEFVRDTQTVSSSIIAGEATPYGAASDTLVIDLSTLPIESGFKYHLFFSYMVQGDWGTVTDAQLEGSTQQKFASLCRIAWHGDGLWTTSTPNRVLYYPWGRGTYLMADTQRTAALTGSETIHVRAYSQNNSTISFRLDQVIFVPYFDTGTIGDWNFQDFDVIAGNVNTFPGSDFDDGVDSGDANGKFTWENSSIQDEAGQGISTGAPNFFNNAAADYQQKTAYADAEYLSRVLATVENISQDGPSVVPGTPPFSHLYGLHGVDFHEPTQWTHDNFSRTLGIPGASGSNGGWGLTPERYGWDTPVHQQSEYEVNGSVGIMRHVDVTGGASGAEASLHKRYTDALGTWQGGANILGDSLCVSGKFKLDSHTYGSGAHVTIDLDNLAIFPGAKVYLRFNPVAETWALYTFKSSGPPSTGTLHQFSSTFDISSWYAHGVWVGFRIESNRYGLQARVWEDSAGEPVAWNYDSFVALGNNPGSGAETIYTYDYAGLSGPQRNTNLLPQTIHLVAALGTWSEPRVELECQWDDIKVYRGLGEGASDDMTVAIESPDGTKVEELVIPQGAMYFVYWGRRQWSEWTDDHDPGFFETLFNFSSRNWMVGGHLLNRAKTYFFYFRTEHEEGGFITRYRPAARP